MNNSTIVILSCIVLLCSCGSDRAICPESIKGVPSDLAQVKQMGDKRFGIALGGSPPIMLGMIGEVSATCVPAKSSVDVPATAKIGYEILDETKFGGATSKVLFELRTTNGTTLREETADVNFSRGPQQQPNMVSVSVRFRGIPEEEVLLIKDVFVTWKHP